MLPRYAPYAPSAGWTADMLLIAGAVPDLQEKRHSADYDPTFRVTTSDAVAAIATARTAVAHLKHASRVQLRAFLFLLVFA